MKFLIEQDLPAEVKENLVNLYLEELLRDLDALNFERKDSSVIL